MAYTALTCDEANLSVEDIISLITLTKDGGHAIRIIKV